MMKEMQGVAVDTTLPEPPNTTPLPVAPTDKLPDSAAETEGRTAVAS